MAKYLIKNRV